MTYREKIQELSKKIESIYDDAEWLRDVATEEEKKRQDELQKKQNNPGESRRIF